jgi:hypothetical protein
MSRVYFRKGRAAKAQPKHVPVPRKPKLSGTVMVILADGKRRIMSAKEAALQLARSKGGKAAHRKGVAPKFTSETGKAARAKQLSRRSRAGYLKGRRLKNRPSVSRVELRLKYALQPERGYAYDAGSKVWYYTDSTGWTTILSEKQALTQLGHYNAKRKQFVPVAVLGPVGQQKKGR